MPERHSVQSAELEKKKIARQDFPGVNVHSQILHLCYASSVKQFVIAFMSSWIYRIQQATIPKWLSQGLPRKFVTVEVKGFLRGAQVCPNTSSRFSFTFLSLPELNWLTERSCITLPWVRRDKKIHSTLLIGI